MAFPFKKADMYSFEYRHSKVIYFWASCQYTARQTHERFSSLDKSGKSQISPQKPRTKAVTQRDLCLPPAFPFSALTEPVKKWKITTMSKKNANRAFLF